MKNEITMHLRRFPVLVQYCGEKKRVTVTVSKEQLRASQTVGQSSKELIERLCDRQGYDVEEINKPYKLDVVLDLDTLADEYEARVEGRAKWTCLYIGGADRRSTKSCAASSE